MYETDDPVQSLLHLYVDGAFNRRELIQRLVKYTGSVGAAVAAVDSLGIAEAQTTGCAADVRVPENAPDIDAQMVTIHGEGGSLFAYLVKPRTADGAPRPGVVVIHENRGLVEHIKDVTRRVARAGFVGLGIDLLSRQGGTERFTDAMQQTAAYGRTTPAQRREDLRSAMLTLMDQPYVLNRRVGCVGFCAGGANSFDMAVANPELTASVVFYGAAPNPIDQLAAMNAKWLGIFAQNDRNINSGLPAVLTAVMTLNKTFGVHVYEGVGHAFHNDTGPAYNRAAACDAWAKTIEFFNKHLNAPVA